MICRLCLSEIDENCPLSVDSVGNLIMLCSSVNIDVNDGLPRFICKSCNARARDAFEFRVLCEESDMYLRSNEILKIDQSSPVMNETEAKSEDYRAEKDDSEVAKKRFKCHSCDLIFYYKKRLIKHEEKHKDGFTCKDCGKDCASAKHLAIHINIKKRRGSHLCQICGKEYTMPENLKRHQRIHNGIRPFCCQLCDKTFTQSNELKSHMISHSSEKKFLCNFCGQKYARDRSLQVHIARIHVNNGEKYVCSLCGRAFKGMVDMKSHQLTHGAKKNHICQVCNKGFNKRSNLKVHERIHTGQKPFVCHICQKAFIQKHVLSKHLNTHPVL